MTYWLPHIQQLHSVSSTFFSLSCQRKFRNAVYLQKNNIVWILNFLSFYCIQLNLGQRLCICFYVRFAQRPSFLDIAVVFPWNGMWRLKVYNLVAKPKKHVCSMFPSKTFIFNDPSNSSASLSTQHDLAGIQSNPIITLPPSRTEDIFINKQSQWQI